MNLPTQVQDWREKYTRLLNDPPKNGNILKSSDDSGVLLVMELKEDMPPFIFGKAYVPDVVGQELGWFAHGPQSQHFHGWKCILMPRARNELIQKYGLQWDQISVKSLRVIKVSQSGRSILCEIAEYQEEKINET